MKKKIRIAIIECYPNRAEYTKKLLKKTKYSKNIDIKVFQVHKKDKYPGEDFDGIIYTGGAICINEEEKYPYLKKLRRFTINISKKNVPILGLCLGHQIIADVLGGKVDEMEETEVGFIKIKINKKNLLLKGLSKEFYCFCYHEEFVSKLPKNFQNYASSDKCKTHLMKCKSKPIFSIQFHPEYDRETTIKIIEYSKKDLLEEGFDIKRLIKETGRYSEKVSIKIFENFIDIVLKNRRLR